MTTDFPWGDTRRFHSYNNFLLKQFGCRPQKVAIDAGFTCPNRDGRCGTGGCTFCLNNAFNPAYCDQQKSITQQLADGVAFHQQRRNSQSKPILAYFQAYSNTYAPLEHLQALYEEALQHPDVCGIIIATRPDCLNEAILDYLEELQTKTYVTLEVGLESCNDETLHRINRGHTLDCAIKAFEQIAKHHIPVGTHLIFGFPGEQPQQWLEELSIINSLSLHNIKFHQLQIIHGTVMAAAYATHPEVYPTLTFEAYTDFMTTYLERLDPNIIVERFASEVPPRYLARPGWGGIRYDAVVKAIEEKLERNNSWQGKLFCK